MNHFLHLEVNQYETILEALLELSKSGYAYSFKIEKGKAVCIETGDIFDAEDLTIVEFHRFEGDTDPADMSVIFVVENDKNINGCIIDAYGTYADKKLSYFLDKVKIGKKQIKA